LRTGRCPAGDSGYAESSIGSANRITAVYRVDLASFNLGDVRLEQRFNLILKPRRTAKLDKNASTGYSGFAAVCGVKFIPISGDRPDNPGIKLMSETNDIEVWLVSLLGTEMCVPYHIVLPTLVGYGSATSTSFEIQRGAERFKAADRVKDEDSNPKM
jgi:hypothetical protein